MNANSLKLKIFVRYELFVLENIISETPSKASIFGSMSLIENFHNRIRGRALKASQFFLNV